MGHLKDEKRQNKKYKWKVNSERKTIVANCVQVY